MSAETGKYIIIAGAAIVFIGILVYFFHDKLHWVGRLPGDIRIDRGNVKIYFPITTMILLSIGISVVVYIIRRFL